MDAEQNSQAYISMEADLRHLARSSTLQTAILERNHCALLSKYMRIIFGFNGVQGRHPFSKDKQTYVIHG